MVMRVLRVILLTTVVVGARETHLLIKKCCGAFQVLSGDGLSCVDAPWSRNHSVQERAERIAEDIFHLELQPNDAPWMSRWLPPGDARHRSRRVILGYLNFLKTEIPNLVTRTVETSSVWNEHQAENEGFNYWRRRVVFDNKGDLLRHEAYNVLTGSFVSYSYCVDAARPPLGPYALLMEPECEVDECVTKCCPARHVMQVTGGEWACRNDSRGFWAPSNSSVARFLPAELPFQSNRIVLCSERLRSLRLATGDARLAHLLRRRNRNFLFSIWSTCVDFERAEDGALAETLFYCPKSRITRGVYWMLRPLCFLSASLLVVALLTIVCDSGMRRKTHGRCLVCHSVCLLAHNVGHIAYYLTISDEIDDFGHVPPHLKKTCPKFAFPIYFVLIAANCWLTALCFNMALGFGKLHVARPGDGKDWRRFLALSAFAWGLPTLMTGLCAHAFENDAKSRKWYSPSLMETRTCYNELSFKNFQDFWYADSSMKYGTALFYYGPVCILVVVNTICIAHTLRKVHFLRRGSHILHREEDRDSGRVRRTEAGNSREDKTRTSKGERSTVADAKTIRLYVKMLLTTGIAEVFSETFVWSVSYYSREESVSVYGYALSYRATGYVADCFRAGCVAWLAAPEGGYVSALRRWMGGGQWGRAAGRSGASGTSTWRWRTERTCAPLPIT